VCATCDSPGGLWLVAEFILDHANILIRTELYYGLGLAYDARSDTNLLVMNRYLCLFELNFM
jgi:hypothetical protein